MDKKKKSTKLYHSLTTVGFMIAVMFTGIVVYDAGPHIPLVFACMGAGLVALWIGYSWDEILDGMLTGIVDSLEAILILLLIGMLVGSWIACGTVPSLICYGLNIVTPGIFLPATMVICLIVAFAIGSWGTVGTMGIAFMGIGTALGIPVPLTAGAVVSGAYMGEVVSPLSDATNLTAAVVNRNVFDIVKKILPAAVLSGTAAAVLYWLLGKSYAGGNASAVQESVTPLVNSLKENFAVTPIALLPLLIMVVCILVKLPAIPSMLAGSIIGMIEAAFLQKEPMDKILEYAWSGFVSETGNELIDTLLTAGGMSVMLESVAVIILAMAFGGIMRKTGQMEALTRPVVRRLRAPWQMSLLTVVNCIFMNTILPDQYLAISMPGQMYGDEYDKRGLSREELGSTVLGGGAVTSPLVPWNTCGIYCMTILGVSPLRYGRYALFGLILPVVTVLRSFIRKKNEI